MGHYKIVIKGMKTDKYQVSDVVESTLNKSLNTVAILISNHITVRVHEVVFIGCDARPQLDILYPVIRSQVSGQKVRR